MLTTVVGATVGLTGFVVTVSVLVVQMATGTFSARYMRLWYRDSVLKATLAVLMGTLAFSYSLLRRIDEGVPDLGVTIAGFLLGAGLILFLIFLDRFLHRLRPVKVAALAAHRVARRCAPPSSSRAPAVAPGPTPSSRSSSPASRRSSCAARRSGALQAIDDEGLLAWATRHDAVIVMRHGVGDFVSSGAVLLEVHGSRAVPDGSPSGVSPAGSRSGVERTIDQDPAFALRILVDVAIRALSPAVNDPTTAVQVIDHLEDTLGLIGRTPGLDGRWEYRDDAGTLRLVMPAHRFEDFLSLGVTEIREYGASSIQVVRRLRAALLELEASVLPEYAPAVTAELERLRVTAAAAFGDTPDAELALRADRQGIGGPPRLDEPPVVATDRPTA